MTDTPPSDGGAAEPELRSARRSIFGRVSIVWLVPVLALLVSLFVVWQNYSQRGPLIEIAFEDASGIRADETQLRYRDVVVGVVEAVRFTGSLDRVLVEVRVDKSVGPFVDNEARFWVVTPQVSAQGVSGLDTILSGVFIEGDWDGTAGPEQRRFDASESAPLVRYGQDGVTIRLRSNSVDGLSTGTPILYRGIEVGQIANLRLAEDGVSVEADAFINAPESRLINSATRFWDTSGFNFRIGAQGASLDVASIASLVAGGVSFDTFASGGDAVEQNAVFRLYDGEDEARSSVFSGGPESAPVTLGIIFDETVPGLEIGDDVDFGGITVGQVTALSGILDEEQFGDRQVRLVVNVEIQAAKLGLDPDAPEEEVLDFLDFAVNNGLRAQLQTASILGGLQIGLVQLDDVPDADLDLEAQPYPRVPSVPPEISDFADTAEGVFNRVNALPVEELLNGAIEVMASVDRLLNDEGVTETPREVLTLLGDVRALVASEGVQGLPDQASDVMASLQATATDLQGVVEQLNEAGAVESLVAALDAAETAANSVYEAVDEVPETLEEVNAAVASLDALIIEVNDLPLASVVAEVEGSVAALRTLLAAPATQGITGDVSNLLTQVEGLVGEVRESGLVEDADATLNELRSVTGSLAAELTPLLSEARIAVASAQGTIDALPGAIESIDTLATDVDALVRDIDTLPLDAVVDNVNTLLSDIDGIVAQSSTQGIPEQVSLTLAEARGLIAELAEGGLVAQAEGTLRATEETVREIQASLRPVLSEAQRAAASVAAAADQTPAVVERANRIAAQIEALTSEASGLPLEELSARVSELLESANTLIASDDTRRLPGALSDALGEVQRLLIQLQDGGLIDNANATLAATEQAAASIAAASGELPGVVARINAVLAEAEGVVAGYEVDGALGSEARSTLRDIREAAQSVDALARQLERSPNSLLFGR